MKEGVLSTIRWVEGEEHVWYGNLRTEAVFEDFNLKLK